MAKVEWTTHLGWRTRHLPWMLMATVLLVLGAAIFFTARHVRWRTREEIINRDGMVLSAVARVQADRVAEDLEGTGLGSLEEPANQLMVLLETSRLSGAIAVRLFDAQGRFVETFPADVLEAHLRPEDLPAMRALQPVSHFQPAKPLDEIFYPGTMDLDTLNTAKPVLQVNVPLHTSKDNRLLGIAQFLIEGHTIAALFHRLDRNLASVSLLIFILGGGVLTVAMSLAYGKLRRAHELLQERTHSLVKANQELALAAKASAVGALTAHLIHGLKNPLSGLQSYMKSLDPQTGPDGNSDWQQAIASTRRMQSMISQVITVLREQEEGHQYLVTMKELGQTLASKVQPLARERGVRFEIQSQAEDTLNNRTASLATLILVNLIENALYATPAGGCARLTIRQTDHAVIWEVTDEGPGFPESLKPLIFSPCPSTREGGSGIGLAISKRLAAHLGAELQLQASRPHGCLFILSLPKSAYSCQSTVASNPPVS